MAKAAVWTKAQSLVLLIKSLKTIQLYSTPWKIKHIFRTNLFVCSLPTVKKLSNLILCKNENQTETYVMQILVLQIEETESISRSLLKRNFIFELFPCQKGTTYSFFPKHRLDAV